MVKLNKIIIRYLHQMELRRPKRLTPALVVVSYLNLHRPSKHQQKPCELKAVILRIAKQQQADSSSGEFHVLGGWTYEEGTWYLDGDDAAPRKPKTVEDLVKAVRSLRRDNLTKANLPF